MKNKNLLSINLNEFDYKYLIYGSKKYKLKNLKELLSFNKIKTYTNDKVQNENLDPWVQCVSINTGCKTSIHKISELNQKIPNNINQIWDVLSKKKIKCGVWGPMNAIYRQNKFLKFFFPDPWNFNSKLYPKNLKKYFNLPNYYAQNYADVNKLNFTFLCIRFLFSILFTRNVNFFIKNFYFFFRLILTKGLKNYILFFLFDIISLNIFLDLVEKKKTNYSHIFFNSLAHFQHNNWNDIKFEKDYFELTDKLIEIFLNFTKKKKLSIIIYNGFTQKKEIKYLFRPKNPVLFLKKIGINFYKLEQDMTHGGIIYFNSIDDRDKSLKILKNFNVFKLNLFETKILSNTRIFYRIKINSKIIFTNKTKNINKYLFSDKKKNIFKKKNSFKNNKLFFKYIDFIKSTGIHSGEGVLFYNFISQKKIKNKKIHNTQIFKITKNFFLNEK